MTMLRIGSAIALATGAAMLGVGHPARAETRHICWIERITRAASGVDVSFMSPRAIRVQRADGSRQTFFVDHGKPPDPATTADGTPVVPALRATVGDSFFASNIPEDSCSMTVVMRDGRIGVDAAAQLRLPGLPPQRASEFIPAE